jgi:hypothetical protein
MRTGQTTITSISLTKEFRSLLEKYKISPSEAMRKGIAIELYERGVGHYMTEKNRVRSSQIKELLTLWENIEKSPKNEIVSKLLKAKEELEKIIGDLGS